MPSTIDAARDWLERAEKRPEQTGSGRWRWDTDQGVGHYSDLPDPVYARLSGYGGERYPIYPTRERAFEAAVDAAARAMGAGWEPEKEGA